MAGKDKVRVSLSFLGVREGVTPRRVRMDPGRKREEYIRRLEEVMATCDRIAADPKAHDKLRLRSLNCLIRTVRACYSMVTDLEIEIIEQDVKELEREEAEQGYLGYRLPESTE